MSLFNFANDGLILALVKDQIEARDNQLFCYACNDDPAYLMALDDIEELLAHLAYEWWLGRFDESYQEGWGRMFPDDFVGGESFYKLPGKDEENIQRMREAFKLNRKMNPKDQAHFDLLQDSKK